MDIRGRALCEPLRHTDEQELPKALEDLKVERLYAIADNKLLHIRRQRGEHRRLLSFEGGQVGTSGEGQVEELGELDGLLEGQATRTRLGCVLAQPVTCGI